MISKTCDSQASELNNQFKLVEQSVKNLYEISEKFRPDISELTDEKVAAQYVEKFQDIAITAAENTDGALAIYYRMNPEISNSGKSGFFWVKSPKTGVFEEEEATDICAYDENDVEHVGWYYIPIRAGKAIWMEPYYNANIDVEMISYVVPIYDENNLVGVVGIDVDFNNIKAIAENIDIYESSGAVLCSMDSKKIYFNYCDLLGETISDEIFERLDNEKDYDKIFTTKIKGAKYSFYYKTLNNGMKYLIYARNNEIYRQANITIYISLLIFSVVFAGTLSISFKFGKKIVNPITSIIEATKKYAQGDWNVKVECDTDDELQLLTENISIMADETKSYIRVIQDMAKKDTLTGLRNKNAYMLYVQKIEDEYIKEGKKFAVVVFDINYLKKVNDNFGHEKGDELIIAASKVICKTFAHSPVFRIGGDEFVAIIDGGDYDSKEMIIKNFHREMAAVNESDDIMNACVSSGMAVYGTDGLTYDELFEAADQRMYQNKMKMKKGEAPR